LLGGVFRLKKILYILLNQTTVLVTKVGCFISHVKENIPLEVNSEGQLTGVSNGGRHVELNQALGQINLHTQRL
jgi:hypothetical protein